jgi:3-oxoacyl-[acyl-carrier protein] reductase
MFDLKDKTALITGASGGIGKAIAQGLYAQGANVALTGRNKEALESLAKELGDASRVHVIVGDLSSAEAAEKIITDAEAAMGQVDILINNAGLTRDTLSMRMTDEAWQNVIDVNLTAAFRLSRAAMKGMMKRRFGRIISISSIVGTTGNPGQANYCASKAGLIGMTKAMAQEVGSRGITLNCVAPGFIATAMTDALNDDQKNTINAKIPAQRMGTPEEIASAVVYLASNEAGYVTGQTIHVNGGMAMI